MIETKNLSKSYGAKIAVRSLNLVVRPGEVYALLGANGAGKSTTIKMLLGFLAPTDGEVTINGKDVVRSSGATRIDTAYIPEDVRLFDELTGVENLRFFARMAGIDPSTETMSKIFAEVGLSADAAARRTSEYSKGMRQKVGIAAAMVKMARVLLLDEPTSGLDPEASNEFTALLRKTAAQGSAVLMATHDLFCAHAVASKIGVMYAGELVAECDPRQKDIVGLERFYVDAVAAARERHGAGQVAAGATS